jgi:probable rRNA maturation factor
VIVDLDLAMTESVPAGALFQRWADAAADLGVHAELSIRIVDEAESAELNQSYRHKTGPTNILSFPCEVPSGVPNDLLGDLVICAPVVEREAREQGKLAEAHWAHMVVHGVLHLRGYDHLHDVEAEQMESMEIQILSGLGYPNPYEIEEAVPT